MAVDRPALVLHLTNGNGPLLFALEPDDVEELAKELRLYVEHGSTRSIRTKGGTRVIVNFAHVAAAYVDETERGSTVFGLH